MFKYLFLVALALVAVMAEPEPEAEAARGYYGGRIGHGRRGYYGGGGYRRAYGGRYGRFGKREAEAEPEAEAEAEAEADPEAGLLSYGYGLPYATAAYGYAAPLSYGYGYASPYVYGGAHYIGKREAEPIFGYGRGIGRRFGGYRRSYGKYRG